VVTHQLQVKRRTAKARRPKTDVLPLDHATKLATRTDVKQSYGRWIGSPVVDDAGGLYVWYSKEVSERVSTTTSRCRSRPIWHKSVEQIDQNKSAKIPTKRCCSVD